MSRTTFPVIECVEITENYGKFVVEPLERGFGITLGNALRRVLLSALPGAAVTQVKIEGVQHEFSILPHVKEDMVEFLLNVKQIRLRPLSEQPGKLRLEAGGEGLLTAADIQSSADYEIVNPELPLATLDSPEAKLTVEFYVEQGKGYAPASRSDGLPIGVLPVDAVFTPVKRANYTVEPIRIALESSVERLTLELWTDGTITPTEGVIRGARILTEHLALFTDLAAIAERDAEKKMLRMAVPPEQYNMPVEQLLLSVRTLNCLRRGNIITVGELLEQTPQELMALKNFGTKSMTEVQSRIYALGLPSKLGPPPAVEPGEAEVPSQAEEDETK